MANTTDTVSACVALTFQRGGQAQRPTIQTVSPSDIRTDSRKRAECDSACRLTLNGFVRVSGGQGKPLPMTSEGQWSRRGNGKGKNQGQV